MSAFWYYGLGVLAAIIIAFVVYALVMVGLQTSRHMLSQPRPGLMNPVERENSVSINLSSYSSSTFKFKKGFENSETPPATECVVCLTDFEDEEYVRQLSDCSHSFHAPCIDMWLYTHSDCPLCRTPIQRLDSDDGRLTIQNSDDSRLATAQNSMEGLMLEFHHLELPPPPDSLSEQ